ncbi:MAG: hypothetical protein MI974_03555 [Chitinophagales bacterium]|nr:hypothetical protein [Chitinophagales bacterium]
MKIKYTFYILISFLLITSCEDLSTVNNLTTDRDAVISSGSDLQNVLKQGYENWWQAIHSESSVIALSASADIFTLAWDDFGAHRMSAEPRQSYNNQLSEADDYRAIIETPWYRCLAAAADANDILRSMDEGITIDKGGAQDQSIAAAAHMLRGLSWGYLGLLFDQTLVVDEKTTLSEDLNFVDYKQAIAAAVAELELAIELAEDAGIDFIHTSFNGMTLGDAQFAAICHSYAARFLAQWPRTPEEAVQVNWDAVLAHSSKGISENFAPEADGKSWTSYHRYIFAEAGEGPFWARIDQRLVAALDNNQPARYPEVEALGEPALANPEASSNDQRLENYFIYRPFNAFPVERGEWHFSHYQYNRNIFDPSFSGNGQEGLMPVFLKADNELLTAEALLHLGQLGNAITAINNGSRVQAGGLAPLAASASVQEVIQAIYYERLIELLGSAPVGGWLDRRRLAPREDYTMMTALGGLQLSTPAQLPVPVAELRVHGIEAYNFGGEMDPEGIVKH